MSSPAPRGTEGRGSSYWEESQGHPLSPGPSDHGQASSSPSAKGTGTEQALTSERTTDTTAPHAPCTPAAAQDKSKEDTGPPDQQAGEEKRARAPGLLRDSAT